MPAAGVSADSHNLVTCMTMSVRPTMAWSHYCLCEVFFHIPKMEEEKGQGLLGPGVGGRLWDRRMKYRQVVALPQG